MVSCNNILAVGNTVIKWYYFQFMKKLVSENVVQMERFFEMVGLSDEWKLIHDFRL
jgi:hypothetical protein